MVHHLIKCKENYSKEKIEQCPFNAMHIWLKGEKSLEKHLEACSDKYTAMQSSQYVAPSIVQVNPILDREDNKGEDWIKDGNNHRQHIQIGRNELSYKSGSVKKEMHKQKLENYKSSNPDY